MNLKVIGKLTKEIERMEKETPRDADSLEIVTELKNAFIQIQNDLQRIDNVLNAIKSKEKS